MKLKFIALTLGLLAIAAHTVSAQSPESHIKIYQSQPGIVKVIYAMEVNEPLTVKFIRSDGGVDKVDRIKGEHPRGILKRYDVSRFGGDFMIELSSANLTVSYKLEMDDSKRFTALPLQAVYQYPMVASKD